LSQARGLPVLLPDAGFATVWIAVILCTPSTQLDCIIEERVPPEGYPKRGYGLHQKNRIL
jgi:hypothetical protein